MFHFKEISVSTRKRCHWVDVTNDVISVINQSGIENGVATISSRHTTAGLTINENADPDVERDFFYHLAKVFPQDPSFHHREGNSDSHLKTSYTGLSVQVPFVNSELILGVWQSIYLCEFDGPRTRKISITLLGE